MGGVTGFQRFNSKHEAEEYVKYAGIKCPAFFSFKSQVFYDLSQKNWCALYRWYK